jgi:predicted PurR-regulated permease PerM
LLNGVIAALTILVLTILLLLQGPKIADAINTLIPDRHQRRVAAVARDSARAISGYISGNLIISIVAGVATWIMLAIVGVPYAAVLGLFVAFCDLIPLVGATLGAIPTIGFAFLHSTTAGITAAVFYVAYQQFENHILGVAVMSRTVRINPLAVLLSVLIAVELFGFLGALLAVPAAGIIQVIVRDLYDERTGRLKLRTTIGADEHDIPDSIAGIEAHEHELPDQIATAEAAAGPD